MHIALLMTNTDESEFAQARPKDGKKFTTMINSVRPDWSVTVFPVKDGVFPPEGARFDGWLIGGSPASVHDSDAWVGRLFALIRRLVEDGQPIFGACFGHQAIAMALGGHVAKNPGGWVFGLVETEIEGQPVKLYGSHREQVVDLPQGAVVLGGTADCPVGSFAILGRVMTTQYHPEMSHEFITDLVEEYASELPPEVVTRARNSLTKRADSDAIAERIARFFEGQR
ncbi:MAG: type 1 glutamine amidotransferase [Alphaproteobacteria bacterium]|nr:type 1 glutamine amidotransferase [Alphaproteobacteria bacterium]